MDESFSGFTTRGGWVAIVKHGERITRALRDEDVSEAVIERWNEWRPKAHERLGEDLSEKTEEQGVTPEGRGETARAPRSEDRRGANGDRTESSEKTDHGDAEKPAEKIHESVEHTARAADSVGRKTLRAAERAVYRTVMRKTAPYYFNDDLVSARIERGPEATPYLFNVTIKDHDLKERVSNRLARYDEEVERWHVDTEKQTETAEAAEGVESPASDADADSTTT